MIQAATIAFLFTAAGSGQGDNSRNAGKLRADCEGAIRCMDKDGACPESDATRALYCWGYLRGFVDGDSLSAAASGSGTAVPSPQDIERDIGYCLPAEVSNQQLAEVYVKYAREHPERLHYESYVVARLALMTYFACTR